MDLILAGDGDQAQRYKELADQIGLLWVDLDENSGELSQKLLIFWGRANRDEMKSLLAGSEMLVVPSRKEPFGLIVLEGMAVGTTVIASRVGGIPEIVSDNTGLLVPPEDESGLSAAMERIIEDKTLKEKLIEKGRKRASEFNWDLIAEEYLSLSIS